MKNLGKLILLTLILLCLGNFGQITNIAQERRAHDYIADELDKLNVGDVSKILNQEEREKIVRLITKSYIEAVRHKQSEYISAKAPVYLLLKTNYPSIKEREEERGVLLGNIVKFFNSKPEYREIINSVLMENKRHKCS